MKNYSPKEILEAFRNWSGTIDELAVLATILAQGLGLEPDPSTAAKSHIAPRTVRYYITQGLLSPAKGQTRNAVYTYHHLLELLYIKCMQKKGMNLDQIRERVQGEAIEHLETILLAETPARTNVPLPNDPDLFDKYHWSTVLNYWTRTSPYSWKNFLAQGRPTDVAEAGLPFPAAPPPSEEARPDLSTHYSPARPWSGDDSRGAQSVDHEIARYVHIDVEGVQLVVPEDHRLAQDPAYRRQLVARLRQWLRQALR